MFQVSRQSLGRLPSFSLDSGFGLRFQIPVWTSSIRSSISGFRFPVSGKALVRLPGSSLDSSLGYPFSVRRARFGRALLASQFSVSVFFPVSLANVQFQPGFRSTLSGFQFLILVWSWSALFSISGFRFPNGLSCDCPVPACIPVSGFWFQISV